MLFRIGQHLFFRFGLAGGNRIFMHIEHDGKTSGSRIAASYGTSFKNIITEGFYELGIFRESLIQTFKQNISLPRSEQICNGLNH